LWDALATDESKLQAALRFQAARSEVIERGALRGEHREVQAGQCGPLLAADHHRLQERGVLEERVREMEDLRPLTGNVWAGLDTSPERVERAKQFHAAIVAAVVNLSGSPEDVPSVQAPL
jgi:hypothetical protein